MLNMSSFSLVCFFVFCSLPDSPAEPDPENQQGSSEEPKVIPHDEVCSDCKFLSVFAKSLPFCFGALIIFRSWSFAFFCDSRTLKETLTPWPLDRKIGCLLTFQRGNWSFRPKVVRTQVVSLEVYLSFFKPFDSPDGCSPGLDWIRPMGETTTILLSHSPITPFFF